MRRSRKKKKTSFSGQQSSKDFTNAGIQDLTAFSIDNDVMPYTVASNSAASVSRLTSNEVIVINDDGDTTTDEEVIVINDDGDTTTDEVIVIDDGDTTNSREISSVEYLGFLSGTIVGIRYYTGMVSNNEMVSLDREPQNPYDCNAVRVSNARGEKVGHIKKKMARALASIVDGGLAQMEGIVLKRGGSSFTIPVAIAILGNTQNLETIESQLGKYGYALQTHYTYSNAMKSGSKNSPYDESITSRTTKLTSSQIKTQLDSLFENLVEFEQTDEAKQPQVVKSKLFKHQLQAVNWMVKKERALELPAFWEKINSTDGSITYKNTVLNFQTKEEPKRVRGGILADDMGLGKTLVVISLIVMHGKDNESLFKLENKATKKFSNPIVKNNTEEPGSKDNPLSKTQQKNCQGPSSKIDAKSPSEENKIRIKENIKRPKRSRKRPVKHIVDQISDDDIEIVEIAKQKKSKVKGDKFVGDSDCLETKPNVENVLFQKGTVHPTLIVCPLSVISNWEGQIKEHLHESAHLNVVVYHGNTKLSAPKLKQQDIVITTYQTLALQFKKSKKASALQRLEWLRVVLDEGHIIRNPTALQTQACCALKSERKWILSGTPIQNSIKDLWPMFSFLGLEPFADRVWWQRTIQRPLKNGEETAMRRVQCLMGLTCMRRTKHQRVNGRPIVDLPDKEVSLTTIELLPNEKLIYDKMDTAGKDAIKKLMDDGVAMSRYAEVLVILMRLRQICCHSYLAKYAIDALNKQGNVPADEAKELVAKLFELLSSGSAEVCCVCLDSLTTPVITRCAHIFCKPCITEVILSSSGVYPRCPLCRSSVNEDELVEVPPEGMCAEVKGEEVMNPSTKIVALMKELNAIQQNDPGVKSLVVSQFTSFLKIIEAHLKRANIKCVVFYGGLSMSKRKEAILDFQQGKCPVMLLSLKAGGVGLNLTAASRVFLMDPAWNPAAEEQCFDRVHRLGQTKPVKIVKFICADTIEERIVDIQRVKQEVASKSLQKMNSEQRKNQTLKDLKTLIDL